MFGRKRVRNFNDKIHRIYDRKFLYIENVLNSCTTLDQLAVGAKWASNVMSQYKAHETKHLDKLYGLVAYVNMNNVINKYFDLKQEIILLIFNRMADEIEKQEPIKTEE